MSRRKEKKRNIRSDKILFPRYQIVTTAKQTEPGEDNNKYVSHVLFQVPENHKVFYMIRLMMAV